MKILAPLVGFDGVEIVGWDEPVPVVLGFDFQRTIGRARLTADRLLDIEIAPQHAATVQEMAQRGVLGDYSIGYRVEKSRTEGEEHILEKIRVITVSNTGRPRAVGKDDDGDRQG